MPLVCSCKVSSPQAIHITDHAVAMHLYRIVQEAVNNAIQHGKAPQITITLSVQREGGMILTVHDNGVGFPPDVAKRRGMGLRIMHHRARTSLLVIAAIAFAAPTLAQGLDVPAKNLPVPQDVSPHVQKLIADHAKKAEAAGDKGYANKLALTAQNPLLWPDAQLLSLVKFGKQLKTDAERQEWDSIFLPISEG